MSAAKIGGNSSLRYVVVLLWAVFALFPLYWILITAFKLPKDIFRGPFYLPGVDFFPTTNSFRYLLTTGSGDFFHGLGNSVLFATTSGIFSVLFGAFAAYGLARYEYRLGPMKNDDISFFIVSQRMMPPIVAVIALFVMYRWLGLLDTYFGMILIYTWYNLPLSVYLLTDFIKRIPPDIEYAAAIDGYDRVRQILFITVPLAFPGIAAAFFLAFIFTWNDFLLALMLTFQNAKTLPVVIAAWSANMDPRWWLLSAAGIVAVIPPVAALSLLDRLMERRERMG
ncbi:MAG TPA: carbohydrate ABC transporter permease [Nitrobacter sp.]|jgi:multiple sugar transport system permease protein|nr:carbohydrate ABC transporter permease [Nitrobacter sp.]